MKNTGKFTAYLLVLVLMAACGGGGSDDNPPPAIPPTAATLVFPADNTECNEGTIVSDSQSTVTFQWNASDNTDSYTLNIRNLITNQVQTSNVSTTQQAVTIFRGMPYEWWVVSSNNSTTQTAQSQAWRFYNAGLAVENYAPFPAAVLSPATGASVDAVAGQVTLSWEGEDIDDDIADYDIYFGTDNPPASMAGTTANSTMNVSTMSGTVYYWMVITRDSEGNTSTSEVFEFRVN